MVDLKGKRILLLYAKFFNYDKIVTDKLRSMGAIVDLYDARAELSTMEKAVLKVYKGFFHEKLRKFHKQIQDENSGKQYDYIFSNSYLPRETVISYKKKFPSAKLILYLDDSVRNTYDVENTFDCYDSVKSFDRSDSIKYKIGLQPLFFEDSYVETTKVETQYDLCFIGTIHSDRLKVISKIDEICKKQNLRFFHYCYLQSNFIYYYYWLTKKEFRKYPKSFFAFKQIPSKDVATIVKSSTAILDIQHPLQTGLTMRTIETIGARKKIVTTNADIKYYDICDSNVCIVDRENPEILQGFLESSYNELKADIMNKYSLTGWIQSIFELNG